MILEIALPIACSYIIWSVSLINNLRYRKENFLNIFLYIRAKNITDIEYIIDNFYNFDFTLKNLLTMPITYLIYNAALNSLIRYAHYNR